MRHPDEDDLEEYKRQDREDAGIAHLEERRRREPPIGDPCDECGGQSFEEGEWPDGYKECPRCQRTGAL